ncbi:DUF2865 domain-containing protein [Pararhizobium gei]|uniref:DUF2865 domain-containing protein n=1 Tax=Pararhizobium gei TaxID=1395951 RepID=UPI0023DBE15B|nr:DUF2865 domain-containing protein [Rhizobium gei]
MRETLQRRFGRWAMGLAVVLTGLSVDHPASMAADCLPQAARNPEVMRLERQIAANRSFQVKYGCAMFASFACREISGRIAQASSRLVALSSAAPLRICERPATAKRIDRHRIVSMPQRRASVLTRRITPAVVETQSGIETRCVRLSDGYYFPTPNSGYNAAKDRDVILAQCRFICDDPAMDVYRVSGPDGNADDMVSVVSGIRYADLPSAGAYRSAPRLKACDMNRFYKTVMARTPAVAASVARDVPEKRPADLMTVAVLDNVGLRGTTGFLPPPTRRVRIVGAAFLPEE